MGEKDIKKALVDIEKTQRWLMGELRKVGFSGMSEANLSNIISRKYKGSKDFADSVLEAIEKILRSYKKEVKQTNGKRKRQESA